MQTKIKIIMILGTLIIFCISCQREITNPFDPECPEELFTPTDFTANQPKNVATVNLKWSQNNTHIEGFRIERMVGKGTWELVASPAGNANSWSDNDITPLVLHSYRLYAFARNNKSNVVTASETPVFTGVITK